MDPSEQEKNGVPEHEKNGAPDHEKNGAPEQEKNGSSDPLPPPPPVPANVTPIKVEGETVKKRLRVPIARRGMGTKGQRIQLLTNHFKVDVKSTEGQFFHYSVCTCFPWVTIFLFHFSLSSCMFYGAHLCPFKLF